MVGSGKSFMFLLSGLSLNVEFNYKFECNNNSYYYYLLLLLLLIIIYTWNKVRYFEYSVKLRNDSW